MAVVLGCAGDIAVEGRGSEQRFRHRQHGYRIAPPPEMLGFTWEQRTIEGADLAFRGGAEGRLHLSLLSRCRKSGRTRADARVLAGTLGAGVPRDRFVFEGAIAVHGRPGWTQTFDADEVARVRTVTVIQERCVFDWLLVAPRDGFALAAPAFELWWQSFEPPESRP